MLETPWIRQADVVDAGLASPTAPGPPDALSHVARARESAANRRPFKSLSRPGDGVWWGQTQTYGIYKAMVDGIWWMFFSEL